MDQSLVPVIVVLVIVAAVGLIAWSIYAAAKRRKELAAWAASNGLTYRSDKDYSVENRYPGFECLRKGHRQYAYNITHGTLLDRPFTGFDYHYETYSHDKDGKRKTHHHYFSAVVLGSELPLKPLLIRPEGLFDKITQFVGFDDIDFESAEFSRRFYVKAEDKRWAYDVLHARTMQFLLDQPRYSIDFDRDAVIVYKSSTFDIAEFEQAAAIVDGILQRLPDYLVKQQREGAPA